MQDVDLPAQLLRKPFVVGVEEGDILAAGTADSCVARGGAAFVLLMADVADAWVVETPHHFFGAIGRSIIHEDDLEVLVGLAKHAPDRRAHEVCSVVGRDDRTLTVGSFSVILSCRTYRSISSSSVSRLQVTHTRLQKPVR